MKQNQRILVVDDEQDLLEILKFNLETEGYEVATASSAEEALQQAGGDVTLDIVDDLGHAIDDRSMQLAIERLRYTVPKHYFDEALSGSTPKGDDIIEML